MQYDGNTAAGGNDNRDAVVLQAEAIVVLLVCQPCFCGRIVCNAGLAAFERLFSGLFDEIWLLRLLFVYYARMP
jgi:hypothetical protein